MGRDYWSGLVAWLEQTVQEEYGYISPGDTDLINIVDTADEVIEVLKRDMK